MNNRNKLIYNIALNDIGETYNGNYTMKTWYKYWCNILKRCYSKSFLLTRPTYNGCTICDEWLIASNFKKWFDEHYINKYHIDKDIIIDGNKIYSPETCCFVPLYINSLFLDNNIKRSKYGIGVTYNKRDNNYYSKIKQYSNSLHLGSFDTPEEAHNAWLNAKRKYARKLAIDAYMNNEIDVRIMNAIIKKAYNLK